MGFEDDPITYTLRGCDETGELLTPAQRGHSNKRLEENWLAPDESVEGE